MENGRSRLQQAQEDVDEVKVIMMENLNKADERSGKLGDLEDRADVLLVQSKAFAKNTQKVKEKKRWDNVKMKVLLIGIGVAVGAIVLGLIIYAIVSAAQGK
ncbi:vesicle-associated membrane protein 5 [Polymixia lowei]